MTFSILKLEISFTSLTDVTDFSLIIIFNTVQVIGMCNASGSIIQNKVGITFCTNITIILKNFTISHWCSGNAQLIFIQNKIRFACLTF